MSSEPTALVDPATDEAFVSGLRLAALKLARQLHLERSSDDLTLTQLSVLGTLCREGALTVGELAALERVKPPSMTRTVNALEEADLVRREAHASDGRQVLVTLTDAAAAVLAANRQRRNEWLIARLGQFSPDEIDTLRAAAPLLMQLAAPEGDTP